MIRSLCLAVAVVFLATTLGCRTPPMIYRVRMHAETDGIRRKTDVYQAKQVVKSKRDGPQAAPIRKIVFQETFKDLVPNDLGGTGRSVRYKSNLGTAHVYAERFGASDDLIGRLRNEEKVIDRFLDLIVGWMSVEFKGEAGIDKLSEFLARDVRKDLKNLRLMLLALQLMHQRLEGLLPLLLRHAGQAHFDGVHPLDDDALLMLLREGVENVVVVDELYLSDRLTGRGPNLGTRSRLPLKLGQLRHD